MSIPNLSSKKNTMTLVVAWSGFDDKSRHRRKVSSLYIAADSCINWKGTSRYDGHQKVFASVKHPEIFGFCGDVTFCNMAISQIFAKIDSDILFGSDEPQKAEVVANEMQKMLSVFTVVEHDNDTLLSGINDESFCDIEDSCQYQLAVKHGCDCLLTFNASDFPVKADAHVNVVNLL